ncbi:MAG: DMT family transporter [Rhodoferax sp.]|uniref:DMT family transporter n=1 Tax=Rhodoferax sp. TaxID=50421 RepID=UPI002ACEED4E|nr:DMT family transporter [Rhodoferax sp.]MDZ7892960.1 DMT family transporter [Rhodoferax sp.]
MSSLFNLSLLALAMLAFAGNSLLCRVALKGGAIDAASFTTVRLVSGAITLAVLVWLQRKPGPQAERTRRLPGDGWSALALFVYAAGFSWAYLSMSAATGALLLFGAVQATMIAWGLARGERLSLQQLAGFALAVAGLVVLMLPGVAAPGLAGSAAMLGAGVAWGAYSLLGRRHAAKGGTDPTAVTAGNFIRTVPMALALSAVALPQLHITTSGLLYAVASGALTSGVGYAVWYRVLPTLQATHAATVQLSVPVIAAVGGVLLLGEAATVPMALSGAAILGGIGLVLWKKA